MSCTTPRVHTALAAAALCLAVPLGPLAVRTAHAEDPADKQDARALMQSGVALLKAKDYLGALAVFKDAFRRFPSSKILLNIGTTLRALDRAADAANAYQQYLDAPDSDPARRPEIEKLLVELDRKVVRVELTTDPANVEVRVDEGEWVAIGIGGAIRIPAGEHRITARKPGYVEAGQPVGGAAGTRTELSLTLAKVPAAAVGVATGPGPTVITRPGRTSAGPAGPRSRLGVMAAAHIDGKGRGAAAALGLVVDVVPRLQLGAGALVGASSGAFVSATGYVLTGSVRPLVAIGVPVFFSDGARAALRAGAGVEWIASPHLSVVLELAGERYFNAEMDIDQTQFVPAVGARGRL
ncbi:MAG: hypothetical protein KA297_29830 [Kofleriaceae bacterium]|nr:hypothetical protein [Kofleriaceae bacterium]